MEETPYCHAELNLFCLFTESFQQNIFYLDLQ